MSISATAPLSPAIDRTKQILFAPFDLTKWLVLGFAAFLAGLADGGGGNFSNFNDSTREHEVLDFIRDNFTFVLTVATVVVVFAMALGVVLLWLSSRGKFILLDNVVRNEAAIGVPWKRYREPGNSLFRYRLVLAIITWLVVLMVGAGAALLAWADIQAETFGPGAMGAIALVVLVLVPVVLVISVILWLLQDFAVQVMYLRGLTAREALGAVWRDLVRPYAGAVVVFGLLELVLGIGVVTVVFLATCITCCIAGLPYVSSVLFLPFTVFFRCYSIYFLQQLGPDWQLITPNPEAPRPWSGPSQFTPPPGYGPGPGGPPGYGGP